MYPTSFSCKQNIKLAAEIAGTRVRTLRRALTGSGLSDS